MYTSKIILLTGKGNIANAIIDLLSSSFQVNQMDYTGVDIAAFIQSEKNSLNEVDVIILDLSPIIGYSEQMLSQLKEFKAPIVVLHLYNQKVFADAFLRMGASAYLPVNFYSEDLLTAIDVVKTDETFIGRNVY